MPQLHLYLAEDLAERVRARAKARGVSVSRYLGDVVRRELGGGWPDGYFQTVPGGWLGDPLERPPQGALEEREAL
jgi:hypothetical protein